MVPMEILIMQRNEEYDKQSVFSMNVHDYNKNVTPKERWKDFVKAQMANKEHLFFSINIYGKRIVTSTPNIK